MRPAMVYRLAVALVQRRTKGYWIDPERCRGKVPADLVEELLGGEVPIEELLRHPEKGPLLTRIGLPSRAWWYRYIRWYARAVRRREGSGRGEVRETGVGGDIPGVRHVCPQGGAALAICVCGG
jgi:hypothetical protein